MKPFRNILITCLFIAEMTSGCAFTVGGQELRVRPGTRIPPRAVEGGDGEQDHWEEWDPEGDHVFLIIRGAF